MIPFQSLKAFLLGSCPHTRGDDPEMSADEVLEYILSPYAWG